MVEDKEHAVETRKRKRSATPELETWECSTCGLEYDPLAEKISDKQTPFMFMFSGCQHHLCHECLNGQWGSQNNSCLDLPKLDSYSRRDFSSWKTIYSIRDAISRLTVTKVSSLQLKCPKCRDLSSISLIPMFVKLGNVLRVCPNSAECKFTSTSLKTLQKHLLHECKFCKFLCPFEKCNGIILANAVYSDSTKFWGEHFADAVRQHVETKQCTGEIVCHMCGQQQQISTFDQHFAMEKTRFGRFEAQRRRLIEILESPEHMTERYHAGQIDCLYEFTRYMFKKSSMAEPDSDATKE